MHISEIGLCGGHSSSGVWVDEHARTTVPGLYAAGDLACVPHNYMIGAFVFGDLAGAHAAGTCPSERRPLPEDQLADAHELIYRPLRNPDGPPQPQVEYKLRRFVNDYVAPPKTAAQAGDRHRVVRADAGEIAGMGARTPHELMRCAEVTFIRDCAEMAARASLVRTESRWGLYHAARGPSRSATTTRGSSTSTSGGAHDGAMEFLRRPVADVPRPGGRPARSRAGAPQDVAVIAVVEPRTVQPGAGRGAARAAERAARSPRILELLGARRGRTGPRRTGAVPRRPGPRGPPGRGRHGHRGGARRHRPGAGRALLDDDAEVRRAAADALRELVEVLPAPPRRRAGGAAGRGRRRRPGRPGRRSLDVLRALRLGDAALLRAAAGGRRPAGADPGRAGSGLARRRAGCGGCGAPTRARGAGGGGPRTRHHRRPAAPATLARLADDPEPLVRAAALEAAAGLEEAPVLWRARALAGAAPSGRSAWAPREGWPSAPGDDAVPAAGGAARTRTPTCARRRCITLAAWTAGPRW